MPHPLELARHFVTHYAPLDHPERDVALAAIETLIPLSDATARCCKDCMTTFFVSQSEVDYFYARNLRPPVRCRACRRARDARR